MKYEYKAEDVVELLKSGEPIEKLWDSIDLMQSFLYYNQKDNVKHLVDKISKLPSEERKECVKGLVAMYPFTVHVLKCYTDKFKVNDMQNDMLEWFDISETIYKTCNKFTSLFAEVNGFENEKSQLEEQLAKLEVKRGELADEEKNLKEKMKERDEKKAEVAELDKEIATLEKELQKISEDSIKNKRKERDELKIQKEKAKKTLESENEELAKYKNYSKEFNAAMKALGNAISKLPKDEADSDGK